MLAFLRDTMLALAPVLPWLVGGLLIVALGVIAALAVLLRRARRQRAAAADTRREPKLARAGRDDDDDGGYEIEPEPLDAVPLAQGFRRAMRILKLHAGGRRYRYAVPWYLMIGAQGSGKSTLAAATGLSLPVGPPAEAETGAPAPLKWWFFDRGVILDVDGAMIRRADGRRADQVTWRRLLGLIDRYRPRRPVDGVVLTVAARDLMDEAGRPRAGEEIAALGEALYKRLWEAQNRLGLAFPVYLIVTGLDALEGFAAFAQGVSPRMRQSILGWSSPYPPDAQAGPDWVDEAMRTVDRAVRGATMEMFASDDAPADPDGLLAFDRRIQELTGPLRQLVGQIFKPSAYHEAFGLRGVYFTGDSAMPEEAEIGAGVAANVYSGPKPARPVPVFLHDLFEEKIFPESGIARPARRSVRARNRTVTAAQAASVAIVVVGGIGLWWSSANLARGLATLEPFVDQVGRDLAELDRRRADTGARDGPTPAGVAFGEGVAVRLLEGMTEIDIDSLTIPFMPSSWFSSLDAQVVDFTTGAFDRIILQSMRAGLARRGAAIADNRLSVRDYADDPAETEADPRWRDLKRYVQAVERFETAIAGYNGLNETRSIAEVRDLVDYLFGVRLSDDFLANAGFYEAALGRARYERIDRRRFAPAMQATFDTLRDPALAGLYGDNPLIRALDGLAGEMNEMMRAAVVSSERLVQLRAALTRAGRLLRDPHYAFLGDPAYHPPEARAELIERIAETESLGPARASAFSSAAIAAYGDALDRLAEARSNALGPFLKREDGRALLVFSDPVEELIAGLDTLAGQPFMEQARLRPLPAPAAAGQPVDWNIGLLEEAADLIAAFDVYRRDQLALVPGGMQQALARAGADGLRDHVDDRVARAYTVQRGARVTGPRGEEVLGREVANFAEASVILGEALTLYDTLGLETSYLALSEIVLAQSLDIIDTVEALFRERSFYQPPGGFVAWDGTADTAHLVFGARDMTALGEYLAGERERLSILAEGYVKPVADFLSARAIPVSEADADTLAFWDGVIDALQAYRQRQADTSVAALETFIRSDLPAVSAETCEEIVPPRSLNVPVADYFERRLRDLRRQLAARCAELSGEQAIRAYRAIADAFDRNLFGQYPFLAAGWRPDAREVTPARLNAFFAVYDERAGEARAALTATRAFGLSRDAALDFLDRMDTARALFAGFLDGTSGADVPVFRVTPRFRVNTQAELGGNQVIDWSFAVEGRRTDNRAESPADLTWTLGDPVELALRWAGNSLAVPAVDLDNPALSVSGRRVTLSYDNDWALFTLIRNHRAGAALVPGGGRGDAPVLVVTVPTRPAGGGPLGTARLFVRLEIAAPIGGEAVPVRVPVFPDRAPGLSE